MSRGPDGWQPVDVIVAALTVVICIFLGAPLISQAIRGEFMPEEEADIVAGVMTAALSIISLYVGATLQRKRDDK